MLWIWHNLLACFDGICARELGLLAGCVIIEYCDGTGPIRFWPKGLKQLIHLTLGLMSTAQIIKLTSKS